MRPSPPVATLNGVLGGGSEYADDQARTGRGRAKEAREREDDTVDRPLAQEPPARARRLSSSGEKTKDAVGACGALVRACPELETLTLLAEKADIFDHLLPELQRASRTSGSNLRSLDVSGLVSEPSPLVSYLACFPGLKILDLSCFTILSTAKESTFKLPSPFLTSLDDLRLYVDNRPQ